MIFIGPMKIPVCIFCETPLIKRNVYLAFNCMCDDDIRFIHKNDCEDHSHIKYLSILNKDKISIYEQHCEQGHVLKVEPVMETGWCGVGIKDPS